MEKLQYSEYYKGYIAGYRDGMRDAECSIFTKQIDSEFETYPIKGMNLSTRAFNCLSQAGCTYVSDVAALSEDTIATMRNLGCKTASEIAHWLNSHGICYSAWSTYL